MIRFAHEKSKRLPELDLHRWENEGGFVVPQAGCDCHAHQDERCAPDDRRAEEVLPPLTSSRPPCIYSYGDRVYASRRAPRWPRRLLQHWRPALAPRRR
jgi:hypothetical protein